MNKLRNLILAWTLIAFAAIAYADVWGPSGAGTGGDPQFFVPVTTDTVAPGATGGRITAFINPAGTIAAMTLTLPTGTVPGQTFTVNFHQIVTTLTVTSTNLDTKGLAAPTAATATSTFTWVWDSVSAKWNRLL